MGEVETEVVERKYFERVCNNLDETRALFIELVLMSDYDYNNKPFLKVGSGVHALKM